MKAPILVALLLLLAYHFDVVVFSLSPARLAVTQRCDWQLHASAADTTGRTAPAEVTKIFDDFAPSFESKLLEDLDYNAPVEVAKVASERIQERGKNYQSCLDAGCGTGLSGPHLRPLTETLIGVDLSPKMAALAGELVPDPDGGLKRTTETARVALGDKKRLYDGIFTGDLLDLQNAQYLEGFGLAIKDFPAESQPFDLIVSADVLCYFGDMRDVLQAFANRLDVGGDLIFSTETMKDGDYSWVMLPSERYAHKAEYVRSIAEEMGLTVVKQTPFTPRMELGEKVLGTLHVFTKEK